MLKGFGTAALWSLAQTAVRLGCSFASIKVTAVYLGPAGLALTGALGNFISLLQSTLGNGANTALVNLSAQSRERDPARSAAVVGTSIRVVLALSVAVALVLLTLQRPLAGWLLNDPSYAPVLALLALAFPAVLLGQMVLALFSSQRNFRLVATTNISATVLGALMFVPLCALFGLQGGLIGTVLAYPMVFVAGAWLGRSAPSTRLMAHWPHASKSIVGEIARFYPMLMVHSISMSLATLLVRQTMIEEFGTAQAGLWQSAVRLSDMYTLVVITTLSMYSLPTLSAAKDEREFRSLLVRLVGVCLGLGLLAAGVLYLLRHVVIRLVFTPQFADVAQLWPWQLLGDIFLLAGWPMRSALTAQRRSRAYMAVEVAMGVGLVVATKLLAHQLGPVAGNVAYAMVWMSVFVVLLLVHLPTWRCQPVRPAGHRGNPS